MKLRFNCLLLCLLAAACKPPRMETFEKNRDIPRSQWTVDNKQSFELDLAPEDTAFYYNMYINARHTDAYPYSNLWLLVSTQLPGDSTSTVRRIELPLADTYGKWLGSGVDDIYEHRIPIQQNAIFPKPGLYRFTFEQNMRQNPLPEMLSVGLRIEKAAPRK
ncbi:gliding motility lipoprotein GldH [Chitinophaga sp. SYP-B3965]|uniref:gliding motility lipoprotein GldH n=1 Tax=Chitinophaga sp. SYP-B3965 TaxID=2663120 RepID=UPI0012998C50|nr:gliding motility lipoprotein GldH [Chitinophaga sp. SYP-B3965]MRG46607.1 gliding motility lipoprotein GldH [Chitinophaga sp. SYP-B3965]